MTRLVPGLVVVAALGASALAQPVTQPERGPCKVTIALAPADVRAEIEAWVRAEPRCERELEVRVVPTEDGLYLSARDPQGHVRERVVPDAQSAAVLVVSWMADDSLGPEFPAPTAVLESQGARAATDNEIPQAVEIEAPGLTRPLRMRGEQKRWLSLGVLGSPDGGGLRAQIDLFSGKRWSIGLGGGFRGNEEHGGHEGAGQARVFIGTSHSFGRLSLRAQLGFGADVVAKDDRMETRSADPLEPKAEAGVFANVRINDSWGVSGGPLVEAGFDHDHPTMSLFLGVQRGL